MLLLGFVLLPVPVVLFFFLWVVCFFFLGVVVWSVDVWPLVSAPMEPDWPLEWSVLLPIEPDWPLDWLELPYPPEEPDGFWVELPV